MSRTQSQGIQYFPFAVDFFSDIKTKILRARYGNDGVMIYLYLLTVIYREGYYTTCTEDLLFIISDDLNMSLDTVQQVLTFLVKRSMFDEQLFNTDAVLTSDGIQNRWQEAVKVRAAKRPIEVGKYWLLPKEKTIPQIKCTLFANNSENYPLNSENYPLNSENYPQSKVKESKVNKPPNPLKGRGQEDCEEWKDRFFNKYTVFERKNYNDNGVDYKTLYEEFEKSSYLQKMYSFPRVIKLYEQIANGDFRDKKTALQDFDERAERERYYSTLQSKAEAIAQKNLLKAQQDERFNQVTRDLAKMEFTLAKAELYSPEEVDELKEKKFVLQQERKQILARFDLTESSLIPKRKCKKCNDTGWLKDGSACDCFKKETR